MRLEPLRILHTPAIIIIILLCIIPVRRTRCRPRVRDDRVGGVRRLEAALAVPAVCARLLHLVPEDGGDASGAALARVVALLGQEIRRRS